MDASAMPSREFQVIIFGATGFAGELLAEYFVRFYLKGDNKINFAIAGRNQSKLESLREKLCAVDPDAKSLPIVIGDSGSMEQMSALAERTDVVATTAGPYALYGSTLVEACVVAGTSYCDLTGESAWVDLMHAKHHKVAEEKGAHVVPCAGFDCVPSDLGTYMVALQFKEEHGEDCKRVDNYVMDMSGGFQGGTINTVMNELSNPTKRPERDPSAPQPLGKTRMDWCKGLWYDSRIEKWTLPFFMTPTNGPVVRRSNAQLGYCADMEWRESMAQSLPLALGAGVGLTAVGLGLLFPPTRHLIRMALPQSGQGPTREAMLNGGYSMVFVASNGEADTSAKKETRMKWTASGDPSCIATTIYIAETAICLALNRGKLHLKGGVLTPVSACGNKLWDRLKVAAWDRDGPSHVSFSKL